MIEGRLVHVVSNFDSGDFTGNFGVFANSEKFCTSDTSIQQQYGLTYDDFRMLEMLICSTVEKYLNAKIKEQQ